MENPITNPFLITGYISPEYFCDRVAETEKITDALFNGRNITLTSPRRMGKTGLIKNVFYHLKETNPEIVTIYLDIFSTECFDDFVKVFASAVIGQLDSFSQKVMSKISDYFRNCRPVFTINELTGQPEVHLDIIPNQEEKTLKDVFSYLSSSNKRCYIAIDEFQQIAEYPEKGIEALLRSYIQFIPNVNWIFSGSRQHLMEEMFMSANRPFFQSTQMIGVPELNPTAYYDFASSFFNKNQKELPKEVFDYAYNKFEGHTWYIQSILNRLYPNLLPISTHSVDNAIYEIISEYEYSYQNLLSAYPNGAVNLLKAIAKEGIVSEITSGKFITQYKLVATSSVKSSLNTLLKKELVYKTPKGYIIYDRFMGFWLKR